MLDQRGEGCQNYQQTNYYNSLLFTSFVQTCTLTSIYNGMHTACSYDIYLTTKDT